MGNDLASIASKLGKLIRMLSSSQDGEVLGAARAIVRTLANAGLDVHALAAGIGADDKKFSEEEASEIYQHGVAEGRRVAEQEQSGPFFRNVNLNDEPSWHDIAREAQLVAPNCVTTARKVRERYGAVDRAWRLANREAGKVAALDLRENPMSTKPITHNGDLANLPPALQPLTRQDRWVVWPWGTTD